MCYTLVFGIRCILVDVNEQPKALQHHFSYDSSRAFSPEPRFLTFYVLHLFTPSHAVQAIPILQMLQ